MPKIHFLIFTAVIKIGKWRQCRFLLQSSRSQMVQRHWPLPWRAKCKTPTMKKCREPPQERRDRHNVQRGTLLSGSQAASAGSTWWVAGVDYSLCEVIGKPEFPASSYTARRGHCWPTNDRKMRLVSAPTSSSSSSRRTIWPHGQRPPGASGRNLQTHGVWTFFTTSASFLRPDCARRDAVQDLEENLLHRTMHGLLEARW